LRPVADVTLLMRELATGRKRYLNGTGTIFMDETSRIPLRVYCKNCNTPAGFDILKQSYRCPGCGELTGIAEAGKAARTWCHLNRQNTRERNEGSEYRECVCPSCGAVVAFPEGDASRTCLYCGSALIRPELLDPARLPEIIIPFFITEKEARERMHSWAEKNSKTPEGRKVLSAIDSLTGCYVPYQLVRGPVSGTVFRDGGYRRYQCSGYLEGIAVSTSKNLDNLVLNEMEPFDWSQARPFDYGVISGHRVQLMDLSEADTDNRIREEVREDFLPEIERVLQTSGVDVTVATGDLMVLNALLPVYIIKQGELLAVMNGQTGRIAVSGSRTRVSYPWVIEPLIYTIVLTLALGYFFGFNPELIVYGGMVFGAIIFAIMGDGKKSLIRNVVLKTETAKARREGRRLRIDEEKDILRNPYDNSPVFREPDENGNLVPASISFYGPSRIIRLILTSLAVIFLPVILAAPLRLLVMEAHESFLSGFHMEYGAAWYVLAAMVVLIYLLKAGRVSVYDNPVIHEIMPDGTRRRIRNSGNGQCGFFSMFRNENGESRLKLFLKRDSETGCFAVGMVLFILLGSTLTIVFGGE